MHFSPLAPVSSGIGGALTLETLGTISPLLPRRRRHASPGKDHVVTAAVGLLTGDGRFPSVADLRVGPGQEWIWRDMLGVSLRFVAPSRWGGSAIPWPLRDVHHRRGRAFHMSRGGSPPAGLGGVADPFSSCASSCGGLSPDVAGSGQSGRF